MLFFKKLTNELSMSEDIPRTGSEWVARVNAGPLSPEMQAALDAWLQADSRNKADFSAAHLMWFVITKLETSDVAHKELGELKRDRAPPQKWRDLVAAANPFGPITRGFAPAFAAVVLVIVAAFWFFRSEERRVGKEC